MCWKFARQRITVVFILGLLVSLQLADWGSQQYANAAFFLLPTRCWELLAGALLAKFEFQRGRATHPTLDALMPALGLFLVVFSITFFKDQMQHPGYRTMVPIAGVMLLIWFAGKGDVVSQILSSRLFVAVGLISYSLYLWHQPLFAFARIKSVDKLRAYDKLAIIALAFLLAGLTWWLVERPFRNKQQIGKKTLWTSLLLGASLLVGFGFYVNLEGGVPQRIPPIVLRGTDNMVHPLNAQTTADGKPCYSAPIENPCRFGDQTATRKWVLVGDSHMGAISPELWNAIKKRNGQLIFYGCFFAPQLEQFREGFVHLCNYERSIFLRDQILNSSESIIVLGGRLDVYLTGLFFDNQEGGAEPELTSLRHILRSKGGDASEAERQSKIAKSIKDGVNQLLEAGRKVVIVYPIPAVGWDVPKRFSKLLPKSFNKQKDWIAHVGVSTSYSVVKEKSRAAYTIYNSIPDHPHLIRIFPEKLFCNTRLNNRCVTHNATELFYIDDDHPSLAGARKIVNEIMREVEVTWGG